MSIGASWAEVWKPVWKAVWSGSAPVAPTVTPSAPVGGWLHDLPARPRRTREQLMRERIELGILPERVIEALPEPVVQKVKKAGTITLAALLGKEQAQQMSVVELELELAAIKRRARLNAEDEMLLLM